MIIAHRGFRTKDGENRLIDFENALKFTNSVEFDIRLTKDKQVIIFHDDNFKRIANDKRKVQDLTYQEIRAMSFFQQNLQSLPPLLSQFKKQLGNHYRFVNIEIKVAQYSEQDYEILIRSINDLDQLNCEIVVSSFDKTIQAKILTLKPRFKKAFLFKKISQIDPQWLQKFDYLHPPFKIINRKKNVKYFQKINMLMNPWTYKKDCQAQKSSRLYKKLVNGYISDKKNLEIIK